MTTKELILNEIEKIPEPFLPELLNFMRFLETKTLEQKIETVIMSESSLEKDWLKPEEDEAWKSI